MGAPHSRLRATPQALSQSTHHPRRKIGEHTSGAGGAPPAIVKGKPNSFQQRREAIMTTLDYFYLATIVSSLLVVRFGVPILLTWAIGEMVQRTRQHPS